MDSRNRLLFLGTGGSLGTPVVGCQCNVCTSGIPQNKRLRPSALLEMEGKRYLIDCGPDFRNQALQHNIYTLDGVFLTHAHHDHCSGIDELRIYTFKRGTSLPCIMSQDTYHHLLRRFDYIFAATNIETKYTTNFSPILLPSMNEGCIDFNGWKVGYSTYEQAGMNVNGFRFGDMAFLTDVKNFNDSLYDFVAGVNILIISALRFTPSPMHLSIDESVEFSKRIGAKETWFTHISHELDHLGANAYLPANIRLAYDGLEISFNPEKV